MTLDAVVSLSANTTDTFKARLDKWKPQRFVMLYMNNLSKEIYRKVIR